MENSVFYLHISCRSVLLSGCIVLVWTREEEFLLHSQKTPKSCEIAIPTHPITHTITHHIWTLWKGSPKTVSLWQDQNYASSETLVSVARYVKKKINGVSRFKCLIFASERDAESNVDIMTIFNDEIRM